MLLTITNESPDARDLGFLLHKNPDSVRSVEVAFGTAHVFYPEAAADRCTAALLVEVDPVALARLSRGGPFPLAPYVNDRPYAASSLLSVALRKLFSTALRGQCQQRPDLTDRELQLAAEVPVLPCRDGEDLLRRLFDPLGYQVQARPIPLGADMPGWGDSPYFSVRISARRRLRDLLGHLYVLLPVLDDAKHYWVSRDEIGKLADSAGEWLAAHPERDLIISRYLRHQRRLVAEAIARLGDDSAADDGAAEEHDGDAARPAERMRLRDLRVAAVVGTLARLGAQRVLDLGCGDGRLLEALLKDSRYTEIVGVDASASALERAARRLHLDELAPRQRERVRLLHSALTYGDRRLAGYDAAVLSEVVEHVDPDRLAAVEQAVFGAVRPQAVIVTTPNSEYNVRYQGLAPGEFRHPDHRFEWDRAGFAAWAEGVAGRRGYQVEFQPVGPVDPDVGPPTQLALFTQANGSPLAQEPPR